MKSIFRLLIILLTLGFVAPAMAVTDINFVGPKISNEWGPDKVFFLPGDPDVYEFVGGNVLDVTLPTNPREVVGGQNLNQWDTAGPNTYYDFKNIAVGDMINVQVIKGNFDGNGTEDIVIVKFSSGQIKVCYDYTGSSCSSEADIPIYRDPNKPDERLMPWAARTGDFNGDGKDDVALVAWVSNYSEGYMVFLAGKGTGGANPFEDYSPVWIQKMLPLSLAIGDYNNDGKKDVAVGSMSLAGGNPGVVSVMLNKLADPKQPFEYLQADDGPNTYKECSAPTGLESYDPDSNGFSDLVMTCFFRMSAAGGRTGGPVIILKNNGGNGKSYSTQQEITDPGKEGLNAPYRTALADFNEDGKTDLAVAVWGGKNVSVFEGNDTFKVDDPEVRQMNTAPYRPTFIQADHDKNNDGRVDIVAVARQVALPGGFGSTGLYNNAIQSQFDGVRLTDGLQSRLCVRRGEIATPGKLTRIDADSIEYSDFASARAREVTAQEANYSPGVANTISERAVIDVKGEYKPTYPIDDLTEKPVRCEGVLVFLNFQPEVIVDEVDCYTKEIHYKCVAHGGNTITACDMNSSDGLTGTAATAPSWEGTVNVPADKKSFSFTVTAKDDGGGEYTRTVKVNLEDCPEPGPGQCDATEVSQEVWPNEQFALCVSDAEVGKAITQGATIGWEQTSGPDLLTPGPDKSVLFKNISTEGSCITGVFGVHQEIIAAKPIEFGFNYVIDYGKGQVLKCPAKLIVKPAKLEGSGKFCALNKGPDLRSTGGILAILLGSCLLGLFVLRRHAKQRIRS